MCASDKFGGPTEVKVLKGIHLRKSGLFDYSSSKSLVEPAFQKFSEKVEIGNPLSSIFVGNPNNILSYSRYPELFLLLHRLSSNSLLNCSAHDVRLHQKAAVHIEFHVSDQAIGELQKKAR